MSRIKTMWRKHRVRTASGAEAFADAMYDLGYTTYSGSCPLIQDNSKFHGFTWGESRDEERKKVIIYTPSPEVFISWRASEVK